MDIKINNIIESDLDELYKLGCAEKDFNSYDENTGFWPLETLKNLVNSDIDITLKLVVNNKLVGFTLVMIHPITKKASIDNFFILEEYRYLEKELYLETENKIRDTDTQFISYYFDTVDDPNSKEFFIAEGYFEGNSHLWMIKNISFSNTVPKK